MMVCTQLRYEIFTDLNKRLLDNIQFMQSMMDTPEFVHQLMDIIQSEG